MTAVDLHRTAPAAAGAEHVDVRGKKSQQTGAENQTVVAQVEEDEENKKLNIDFIENKNSIKNKI